MCVPGACGWLWATLCVLVIEPGPLQEQQVLYTAEPSPHHLYFSSLCYSSNSETNMQTSPRKMQKILHSVSNRSAMPFLFPVSRNSKRDPQTTPVHTETIEVICDMSLRGNSSQKLFSKLVLQVQEKVRENNEVPLIRWGGRYGRGSIVSHWVLSSQFLFER